MVGKTPKKETVKVKTSSVLVLLACFALLGTACQNGFMSFAGNNGASVDGPTDDQTPTDGNNGIDEPVDGTGEPVEGCVPDDRFFLREVWAPAVANSCYGCHNTQGSARNSDFVLMNDGWGNYIEENRRIMSNLAMTKRDGQSVLLLKPLARISHGGGAVIEEGDDSHNRLKAFVDRVENPSSCTSANDDAYFRDLTFLDPEQTLRKASLSLTGRLPTEEEHTALESSGMDAALDMVLEDEGFYRRLVESYNDMFLTDMYADGDDAIDLLDEDIYPDRRWYEDIGDDDQRRQARRRANRAVAREPLRLISHVVRNDRPFTEILTADYTVVNPYSARSFGVMDQVNFNDDQDPNEWREVQIPGVPHAGVVTSVAFLNRYPTTATNRNRKRSRIFYDFFMATDVLTLAERPIDPTQASTSQNPTLFDSQCTVCHGVVDPVAGAFQNWDEDGEYAPPEDGWYTDMLPPGLENAKISQDERMESLSWLGEETTTDPRFTKAAVKHVYKLLTGEEPLSLPSDPAQTDYQAKFRAYEVQYEFFKQLGEKFEENNYNLKYLVKEIVKSPYYRTENARSLSPQRQLELANMGTARLLSPEQLHRKIVAITGQPWEVNGDNKLLERDEFNLLYGGIDSQTIVERMEDPNALASSIARRMANEVSCLTTAEDFTKAPEERLLFPNVEPGDTPDSNEAAIKENIQYLHWHVLGEKLDAGDPELERTYNLFNDIWQDGQQGVDNGDYPNRLPGRCRADGLENDDQYTVRAWMGVMTYMLSTYDFLYE